MDPVGFATLYAPPRPVTHLQNVSELWHGDAVTHDGDVRLYLKRATAEEVISECVCAVAGSALGLPIPRVYLVLDPESHVGGGILIGSEDAQSPSLRHYLDKSDPNVVSALIAWDKLHEAAVFDEWIANPDRNQGNLLWDGDKEWFLIDQARALGAYPPGTDVPTPSNGFENELAKFITGQQRDLGVAKLRRESGSFGTKVRNLDFARVKMAARCDIFGMSERCINTLSFMSNRLDHLPALLGRHGSQPDLFQKNED